MSAERLTILHAPVCDFYSLDEDELFERLTGQLDAEGLYRPDLLYRGCEGRQLVRAGSFGVRDDTFAYSEARARQLIAEPEYRDASPVHFATDALVPALVAFDPEKLLGTDAKDRQTLGRVAVAQLRDPYNDLRYWATPDGSSIDTATVAVVAYDLH